MKTLAVAILALGIIGGVGYWYYRYSNKPVPPTVATAAVTRGDIVETVGATGTLQAVTTVQVGSQVSGNIAFLGADFNSLVKKGQVLARLDPSLFEAQAQQSRANLAQARANLTKAQSDLERNRVQLTDAQQKFTRANELGARRLLPQSDLDTAKTAVESAQATVLSQRATVSQVEASIAQAQAGVNQSQVNLDHTVIAAPIDGLVISRNVDVGQTVAASMQAPTLFVLAADLTKMQVVANLDESDVGRIRPKQAVTFRVDAYPTDTFVGIVSQVRLEPKVQQNVVTYATVIDVPNKDLRLKPGMTANVSVEIARASNVLRVPNSALRFRPSNEVFTALGQTPPEPQGRGGGPGGGRRGTGANAAPAADAAASAAAGPRPQVQVVSPPGSETLHTGPAAVTRDRTAATGQDAGGRGGRGAARDAGAGRSSAGRAAALGGVEVAAPQPEYGAGTDRRSRFAERMQNMSPEEREAAMARLRERSIDPAGPGGGLGGGRGSGRGDGTGGGGRFGRGGQSGTPAPAPSAGPGAGAGATTIDALFAPLPRTETFGRAWFYVDKQVRQVRLRLGVTDGQNTELLDGDVTEGSEFVTNVAIAGQTTRPATTAFPGFGQPQRGGFPGGGFPGGGFPGGGGGGRGGR